MNLKIRLFIGPLLFVMVGSTLAAAGYQPLNKSVLELGKAMAGGETTATVVTTFYLHRIEKLNPRYHAIININPEALATAAKLDTERAAGKIRGPLHGIPVILKDNINTADPIPTTAGSLALAENFATEDAPLVASLRRAGAIVLAKANLSEWANLRSFKSISGWSAQGGFTRNAYDPDKNPCGSSSGSAVSAALNLAPLTIGTETDGSILCPASMNGVVGIKPSAGLVSQQGIVPISHSQDTAGPITRRVSDAVFLLQGMLVEQPAISPAQFKQALAQTDLNGVRIGVATAFTGHESKVDSVFAEALKRLSQAGAELIDLENFKPAPALGDLEIKRLVADMQADMQAYLASCPASVKVKNMADLVAFNKAHEKQEMPHFKQEFFEMAQAAFAVDSLEYQKNETAISKILDQQGIDPTLAKFHLDLIVAPSYGVAGELKHERRSPTDDQPGSTQYSAMAGYPSITVPMGMIDGLPLGISFFAGLNSEPTLIRAANIYEKSRGHFKAPVGSD